VVNDDKNPYRTPARWALQIQAYDLDIQYTPGKINVIADTLFSRPPKLSDDPIHIQLVTADLPRQATDDIRNDQLSDPELKEIISSFVAGEPNNTSDRWAEKKYFMTNGVLYHYDYDADLEEAQLVVPASGRARVLEQYHDAPISGHNGIVKTMQRILRRYYRPGLRRYVTDYVKRCIECQRYKPSSQKLSGLLQTPPYASRFEILTIDFFGPLLETENHNQWILVVEDHCTRWVELFAMQQVTAFETVKILIEVFM
jgi:Integrase zinc binding domain